MIFISKSLYVGNPQIRTCDDEPCGEDDAAPDDSDEACGLETVREVSGHDSSIRLDNIANEVPRLWGASKLRTSDLRNYGGCGCGWNSSSFVDDACW